ncbi:exodeoxyribonuclease VII large subunit [Legionella pneumophila]|nr:exodeoxyribonuclease VII large subunit [Legionella pneumophila]
MSGQLPIMTVSQLNRQVKGFLENEIGLVHVEGEISNLSKPSSGHYYFTLKDSTAQIRCAFFKNRHSSSLLRNFNDGQQIVASGKLSLYEARENISLLLKR